MHNDSEGSEHSYAPLTGELNNATSHDWQSLSCLTASTEHSAPINFDMSNRAKLPRGIDKIRPHIELIDNVPLLVSLFTDCTPAATREMLQIMQDYREVACIVGSLENYDNAGIFVQADASIGVEPLYPQVCQKMAAFQRNDKGIGPLELSARLNSVPCSLSLRREHPISIYQLIMTARHYLIRLWSSDMQGYLQTSALPVETPASKSTFNNYDIYVPNYNSIGPFLLQNLQEIERMNFTSLDVLKPEYTYRIAELTQHYLDQSNITSNFYEGTISNVAVMDLNDNYVSLIMGDSKYFGAGEMTSAGYVSDSDNHDEGKISSRIPLIVTDGSMICGRRMVLGASDLTLATQLITSLLIANDNLVDAVEAPRFHLLGNGSIGIESKVALAVVSALHYLYSHLKVIHRDVKPSNILINKKGEVKMCDFGISGHLVDSVAKTIDAGCKPYMAPERIDPQGNPSKYDIRSDVWSLGISLIELATGKFPYPIWGTPFEQLKQVVADEPPRLPPGQFSAEFEDLIEKCLQKSYTQRWNYSQLLQHPFLVRHRDMDTDISEFITQILELPDNP